MSVGIPITEIRQHLHQYPELSGKEIQTARYLKSLFPKSQGYKIIGDAGLQGFIVEKKYGEGDAIAFRAELDALPIIEENELKYRSSAEGMSHACGHDGHMSILVETARRIERLNPTSGTVYFLFQSAEETGMGAEAMVKSGKLDGLNIHTCYALHNIPGLEKGTVYGRDGSFACASVGLRLNIKGKTAHAAHPEEAVNPMLLAIEMLNKANFLAASIAKERFILVTPISLISGENTFGTSPLNAQLLLTLRAERTEDLTSIMDSLKDDFDLLCRKQGARGKMEFEEFFPATVNAAISPQIMNACRQVGINFEMLEKPFRWSEDFSNFAGSFNIYMFGLGAGLDTAPLHASSYDFPHLLIEKGSAVFTELFKLHTQGESLS